MTAETMKPLSKILVPIDGSQPSERAVFLTGCLAIALGSTVQQISLVHVLAGSYLRQHMANIDIRAERVIETDLFKRLREPFVEKQIMPLIDRAMEELKSLGVKIPVDWIILDGNPADKIIETAETNGYSTIVIGRRGLSRVKEFLIGSVTSSILHRPHHPSVYVVGQMAIEDKICPVPSILIPIDGSDCSMAAVKEACVFGSCLNHCLNKIILLRVIDLATYEQKVRENGKGGPEKDAEEILNKAYEILINAGVPSNKVHKIAKYGWPADTILDTAKNEEINLIIIGRYGRSALKDLVIGGVSSQVLHKAVDHTVAIVCG